MRLFQYEILQICRRCEGVVFDHKQLPVSAVGHRARIIGQYQIRNLRWNPVRLDRPQLVGLQRQHPKLGQILESRRLNCLYGAVCQLKPVQLHKRRELRQGREVVVVEAEDGQVCEAGHRLQQGARERVGLEPIVGQF